MNLSQTWRRWRIAWHMWRRGLTRAAAEDWLDGRDLGDHDVCGFSGLPPLEPPGPRPRPRPKRQACPGLRTVKDLEDLDAEFRAGGPMADLVTRRLDDDLKRSDPAAGAPSIRRQILLGPFYPRIVCLCGSTRFRDAWVRAYREESLAGKIILSVGVMLHQGDDPIPENCEAKRRLDELHLRKIELADEVLILNVDGYIGWSTANELRHARLLSKPVRFLRPDLAPAEGQIMSSVQGKPQGGAAALEH